VLAALAAAVVLLSPAFHYGQAIPRRYSCDGRGQSPPLRWTAPPAGTRSLALRVYDPDARGLTHWLAWGIPAGVRGLAGGRRAPREGTNDFGRRGYGAPCPPPGPAHRYVFVLYALAQPLRLAPGARAPAFAAAVRAARVLARSALVATYRRG